MWQMIVRETPGPWSKFRRRVHGRWLTPVLFVDWCFQWLAYVLGNWSFLEVLDYLGRFSVLAGVVFYIAGAKERTEQKHYQAWQVINTAQGKGGSGGRVDALQDLNEDGVPLVGVDVSAAFLQRVRLENADLRRGLFRGADMLGANLAGSNLEDSDLKSANLRNADIRNANLHDVDLTDADLSNARLDGSDAGQLTLDRADLRGADLRGIRNWQSVRGVRLANVRGVRDAPEGFIDWAIKAGAVNLESDREWTRLLSSTPASQPAAP